MQYSVFDVSHFPTRRQDIECDLLVNESPDVAKAAGNSDNLTSLYTVNRRWSEEAQRQRAKRRNEDQKKEEVDRSGKRTRQELERGESPLLGGSSPTAPSTPSTERAFSGEVVTNDEETRTGGTNKRRRYDSSCVSPLHY